ncbi:MAG: thiamine biosynthesis lipoprotein [Acidimicrobiales bacterium]|jgi:FAD:protein FMN transferase
MILTEHRFRAMGTDVHLIVGGNDCLEELIVMIEQLEQSWSRFLPDSEISQLNGASGAPLAVSKETFELIERSIAGWRLTGGRFDPTMLVALNGLGYDRSFELVGSTPMVATAPPRASSPGPVGIVLDPFSQSVALPKGMRFDAGGIGKGLAADLVSRRAIELGAEGVLINLGGDLRVRGAGPDEGGWVVSVAEPSIGPDEITRLRLATGAVATSTTRRRTWASPHGRRHHLLDPASGQPQDGGADLVTVVAGEGWWAEVAATALIAPGPGSLPGIAALRLNADQTVERIGPFETFECWEHA